MVEDYSLRIKRNLRTSHTWVSAFCNDVMASIPSLRVLKEGATRARPLWSITTNPRPGPRGSEDETFEALHRLVKSTRRHP